MGLKALNARPPLTCHSGGPYVSSTAEYPSISSLTGLLVAAPAPSTGNVWRFFPHMLFYVGGHRGRTLSAAMIFLFPPAIRPPPPPSLRRRPPSRASGCDLHTLLVSVCLIIRPPSCAALIVGKSWQDGALVIPARLRGTRADSRLRHDLQGPLRAADERRPKEGGQSGQARSIPGD